MGSRDRKRGVKVPKTRTEIYGIASGNFSFWPESTVNRCGLESGLSD